MNLKEKLKETIFSYIDKYEVFDFDFLSPSNWPQKDGEPQDKENFSCIELTKNHMVIHCGGDWQVPMEIKIECINDELVCTNNIELESMDASSGLDKHTFLNDVFDGNAEKIFPETMADLKEETQLENFIENEAETREPETKVNFEQLVENPQILPHPDIVEKLNTDEFPFNENIFFLHNPTKLGADEYSRCLEILFNRNNNREGDPNQAMALMGDLLRTEAPIREELQDLAIKLVKEMYNVPDSIDLKAMLEQKNPEEECAQCGTDENEEISDERKAQLQSEIEKRRILNSIVHGCAVHQWTSAYHIVRDELNELNPDLLNKYNLLSGLVNYWNWKIYFEPMFDAGHMPVLQGINKVNVEKKEIEASALNFPVLIHELSKGVMDYLISIGIPKEVAGQQVTKGELKYIYSIADKYSHEQWHYFFGPGLWRGLLRASDATPAELPPIVSKMAKMNYSQLANFCIDITFGSEDRAKEVLDNLNEKTI